MNVLNVSNDSSSFAGYPTSNTELPKKIKRKNASLSEHFVVWVSHISFLLLFPGFFVYHTLIGAGLMPAVLGGYFAPISLVLTPFLFFSYFVATVKKINPFSKVDVYFFLFILYFLLIVGINYGPDVDFTITQTHLLSIIYLTDIFIIFKTIDVRNKAFIALLLASLMIMSAIIFAVSQDGSFYLGALGEAADPDSVATYQGFSRSYLITLLVAVTALEKNVFRIVMYCIAASALYLNGARSELVALITVAPFIEIYLSKNKIVPVFLITTAAVAIGTNLHNIIELLPENRVLELFDLSHSSSANTRQMFTLNALRTISEHPLLGSYGSYEPGKYAHNVLSAWVDLGIFGFIYLLSMLVIPLFLLIITGYFKKARLREFGLAATLLFTALFLLITAKTFDDMIVGAAVGAYASYRHRKKQKLYSQRRGAPVRS